MNARSGRLAAGAVLALFAAGLVTVPQTAAAAGLVCRTDVVGVTATHRLRAIQVVNGKVKQTFSTADPLPFDPSGLAYKSHTGSSLVGILALHPSGTPRVLGMKYPKTGATLTTSIRTWEHSSFTPRLITGAGNLYYAISEQGQLSKLTDATAKPKVMNGNYGAYTTLQYAMSYRKNGQLWDVLYGTTTTGALKKIDVPVASFSTIPTITTLRSSGYGGTTALSVGFCDKDLFRNVLITINGSKKVATWTTVDKVVGASWRNTTPRGAVQPGYNWALHAVF